MREVTARIRFRSPCLGNVKKQHWVSGKHRSFFVLMRSPTTNQVIFLPTWWQIILAKAADVLCRHQDEVKKIRFNTEVDGNPRPIPDEFYHRYYEKDRFSKHEAFFAGDVIGVTCIVPSSISDDDFRRLMELAGKYWGISPARPNEFGFFEVVSVQRCGTTKPSDMEGTEEGKKEGPSVVAN